MGEQKKKVQTHGTLISEYLSDAVEHDVRVSHYLPNTILCMEYYKISSECLKETVFFLPVDCDE